MFIPFEKELERPIVWSDFHQPCIYQMKADKKSGDPVLEAHAVGWLAEQEAERQEKRDAVQTILNAQKGYKTYHMTRFSKTWVKLNEKMKMITKLLKRLDKPKKK